MDLCTGIGAIAAVIAAADAAARVLATEIDELAADSARGATASRFCSATSTTRCPATSPVRSTSITAVVPYVPTEEMQLLPRDVRDHEPRLALDGGPGGNARVVGAR